MIYVFGIAITFFLVFILLTKWQKSFSDRVMLIWLAVILLHLTLFAVISSGEFIAFPYFLGLEIPIPLLHGPFLYLYIKSWIDVSTKSNKNLFHFIPFAFAMLSIIPFLLLSVEEKIVIYQSGGQGYVMLKTLILIGIILSGVIYIMLTIHFSVKHIRIMLRSNSQTINLRWLLILISGLSLIWIIILFADDKYIFYAVVLYVLFIGYYGVNQMGIFTNQISSVSSYGWETAEQTGISGVNSANVKYEKSLLNDGQLESIHRQLLMLMEDRHLFFTPELTLNMVAIELDIHPNTLSQVINKVEQKNFFDYVNTLRVEEFKMRVLMPENHRFTLLSLAYECGFNSKTSFNRNFKNVTGQSPSEFLKENQIKLK